LDLQLSRVETEASWRMLTIRRVPVLAAESFAAPKGQLHQVLPSSCRSSLSLNRDAVTAEVSVTNPDE
jgi:hypothetical protein